MAYAKLSASWCHERTRPKTSTFRLPAPTSRRAAYRGIAKTLGQGRLLGPTQLVLNTHVGAVAEPRACVPLKRFCCWLSGCRRSQTYLQAAKPLNEAQDPQSSRESPGVGFQALQSVSILTGSERWRLCAAPRLQAIPISLVSSLRHPSPPQNPERPWCPNCRRSHLRGGRPTTEAGPCLAMARSAGQKWREKYQGSIGTIRSP